MTKPLDPRRHAFRDDVAAAKLKDQVRAARYEEGEVRQVCAPVAPVRVAPRFDAPLLTEALIGETLRVYDSGSGWLWAQLDADGYVGYLPADAVSTLREPVTHTVSATATFVYPAPDLKRPPFMRLPYGGGMGIGAKDGRFCEMTRGGYVFAGHVQPAADHAQDYVRIAERFVGAPYLWGGRTVHGIDCSGLVQIALIGAGRLDCPRDSDMQEGEIGEALPAEPESARRGDLLFWKGHVAILHSAGWLLHASGHQMEVVLEPLAKALARIAETHGPVRTMRRIVPDAALALPAAARPVR